MKKMLPNTGEYNFRGRGAVDNPNNRFEHFAYQQEFPENDEEGTALKTEFFPDHSKTILSQNDSPDVGFRYSLNPYRGCEHGCVYCYARPTHEYLGLSAGLDFESKILVKYQAPDLLRKELSAKNWDPQVIALSGVTDCYQPAEKKFQLTRGCLEVLAEFKNPAIIITKNRLVTRDTDILKKLAEENLIAVFISVTTLDSTLAQHLEPRTSTPRDRLEAIRILRDTGISVGVMVAPIIPALNDVEIPAILHAAARAGAQQAGYTILRLPYGLKEIFTQWVSRHFPDRKEKMLHRIEALRGGKLNESSFGKRMRGEGIFAEQIQQLFTVGLRKAGLGKKSFSLRTDRFHRPQGSQLTLF